MSAPPPSPPPVPSKSALARAAAVRDAAYADAGPGGRRLSLRAADAEDLAVLSALLQDALAPVADMRFEPAARRFVMVLNRFMWESADGPDGAPDPTPRRTLAALRFDAVARVAVRGVDQKDRGRLLSLLTIAPAADAPGSLLLACADGVDIRLDVDRIAAALEDLGEPWPAIARPAHPDADPGAEPGA